MLLTITQTLLRNHISQAVTTASIPLQESPFVGCMGLQLDKRWKGNSNAELNFLNSPQQQKKQKQFLHPTPSPKCLKYIVSFESNLVV